MSLLRDALKEGRLEKLKKMKQVKEKARNQVEKTKTALAKCPPDHQKVAASQAVECMDLLDLLRRIHSRGRALARKNSAKSAIEE